MRRPGGCSQWGPAGASGGRRDNQRSGPRGGSQAAGSCPGGQPGACGGAGGCRHSGRHCGGRHPRQHRLQVGWVICALLCSINRRSNSARRVGRLSWAHIKQLSSTGFMLPAVPPSTALSTWRSRHTTSFALAGACTGRRWQMPCGWHRASAATPRSCCAQRLAGPGPHRSRRQSRTGCCPWTAAGCRAPSSSRATLELLVGVAGSGRRQLAAAGCSEQQRVS